MILLVDSANFNIGGNINLTRGRGFFMVIVRGNIAVAPTVGGAPGQSPNLEGLYLADGTVSSGAGANQLYVRGSVVGYGGVNMQRNLAGPSRSSAGLC